MRPERIADMPQGVSLDTETHLIQRGLLAPPLVCGSVGWLSPGPRIDGAILDKYQTLELFTQVLDEKSRVLVGANFAFDLLVLARELAKLGIDAMTQIFDALADDRVYDLQIAEALNAIACGHLGKDPRSGGPLINPDTGRRGRYSLAMCVDLVLGRQDAKANDEYRERYAELDGVPMSEWPQTAIDYPIDDSRNTIECALAQTGHLPKTTPFHEWGSNGACRSCGTRSFGGQCLARRPHRNLHDLSAQVSTAFAMHVGAAWGFRVNQQSVDVVERYATRSRAAGIAPFVEAGLIREDGSENRSELKRRVAVAYNIGEAQNCPVCLGTGKMPSPKNPKSKIICYLMVDGAKTKTCDGTGLVISDDVPRSDKDGIGYGRDVLHESGDEFLMSYGDFQEDAKDLTVYVPFLRGARTWVPGDDASAFPITGHWLDIPLTLRPNPVLETGRVSYDGVIQLFKRQPGFIDQKTGEYIPSLRECIEAREGWTLGSVDYDSGELVTHAQSCIWITGASELARALLSGTKPHNALGAKMLGMSYEEFQERVKETLCKNARQAAKPPNFGYPGGMGPVKLVHQQRKQGPDTPHPTGPNWVEDDDGKLVRGYKGLRFCIYMDGAARCGARKITMWRDHKITPTCEHCVECAVRLKETWLQQWPENKAYFKFINQCVEQGQVITWEMIQRWPHLAEVYSPGTQLAPGEIMQHVSGRIRGGVEYCAGANGFFQGLLGDIAKSALRRVSRECYDRALVVPRQVHWNSKTSAYGGGESPLYGSRVIVFQHDELIPEFPNDRAHDAAMRVSEIMIDEMRVYCPDLADAAKAPPALMSKWFKGAEPLWLRGGAKGPADSNDRLIPWAPKKLVAA